MFRANVVNLEKKLSLMKVDGYWFTAVKMRHTVSAIVKDDITIDNSNNRHKNNLKITAQTRHIRYWGQINRWNQQSLFLVSQKQ